MEGKTIGIVIAVIVVLAGGWYLLYAVPASAPADQNQTSDNGTVPPSEATIAYSSQGFSPSNVTVQLGATVMFVNQTGDRMWVASAMHPGHEVFDGTALAEHCAAGYNGPAPLDQCSAGASYSFTFLKAGTWGYHNHANASHFGSITVSEPAAPVAPQLQ